MLEIELYCVYQLETHLYCIYLCLVFTALVYAGGTIEIYVKTQN